MKTEKETHKAHDLLVGMILGNIPRPPHLDLSVLKAEADVLCWVLDHEHNQTFAAAQKHYEAFLEGMGLHLELIPEESTAASHRFPPD